MIEVPDRLLVYKHVYQRCCQEGYKKQICGPRRLHLQSSIFGSRWTTMSSLLAFRGAEGHSSIPTIFDVRSVHCGGNAMQKRKIQRTMVYPPLLKGSPGIRLVHAKKVRPCTAILPSFS